MKAYIFDIGRFHLVSRTRNASASVYFFMCSVISLSSIIKENAVSVLPNIIFHLTYAVRPDICLKLYDSFPTVGPLVICCQTVQSRAISGFWTFRLLSLSESDKNFRHFCPLRTFKMFSSSSSIKSYE